VKALLIIDMQNDFMPGGALPVPKADTIIPVINELMGDFPFILAAQDHHPADHVSFADSHPGRKIGESLIISGTPQLLWPVHCVAQTEGAELASPLQKKNVHAHFYKGQDRNKDSYSAFGGTDLGRYLKERGITDLYLTGVAIEYCVLFSALDALQLGFNVFVIADACMGINLQPGASEQALELIYSKGGMKISIF
jgi:nicotinamidase/pyrazinamidase